MTGTQNYQQTRQGVRDLNTPVRPGRGPDASSNREAAPSKVNVGRTERAVSKLGGAVLAGVGVGRGGLYGLAMAALGAGLIYRGASGHCSAYQALGIDTTHGGKA